MTACVFTSNIAGGRNTCGTRASSERYQGNGFRAFYALGARVAGPAKASPNWGKIQCFFGPLSVAAPRCTEDRSEFFSLIKLGYGGVPLPAGVEQPKTAGWLLTASFCL